MDPNSRLLFMGAAGASGDLTGFGNSTLNFTALSGNVANLFDVDPSLTTSIQAPAHGAFGSNVISSFRVNLAQSIPNVTLVEVAAGISTSVNQSYYGYVNGANTNQLSSNTLQFFTVYSGTAITLNNVWVNMASPGGMNNSPSIYAIRVNGKRLLA